MERTRIPGALALAAAAACFVATAAPAAAAPPETTTYSDTYEGSYWDCGYLVTYTGEVTGTSSVTWRQVGGQSYPFVTDRPDWREIHTRADTGESFVVRGSAQFKNVRAEPAADGLYHLVSQQSGRLQVVEDMSGRVVASDRGNLRYDVLTDAEGNWVEFLAGTPHGPHPGWNGGFCSAAGAIVGSDSADRWTLHPAGTTASPLGYGEYLPADYSDGSGSPLIVFLHGFGEGGDGSTAQLPFVAGTGIPQLIADNGWPSDRPFVVLAPQFPLPTDESVYDCDAQPWPGSCFMTTQHGLSTAGQLDPGQAFCWSPEAVRGFLEYALTAYPGVDPSRVYLTGLSCGGFGVWEYLAAYAADPLVAAAVPIAAEGRPALGTAGCSLGTVPVWAFHGLLDDTVEPAGSIDTVAALQACPGAEALLTTYDDRDHDSWTRTYTGEAAADYGADIYAWFLDHTSA